MIDLKGSKYLLIRDIERCPYVPKDPEYVAWMAKDDERRLNIIEARRSLHIKANQYLSHEDRNIRNLALFYNFIFGDME